MNRLWYKSWLETRLRFNVAAFTLLPLVMLAFGMVENGFRRHGGKGPLEVSEHVWANYLGALALLVAPFVAMILAGSGLNTQTAYGMTRGFHGSMFHTLALPVRRRDLLWTRGTLGLVCFLVYYAGAIVCLPLAALFKGMPLHWTPVQWDHVGVTALLVYSLALVPAAVLDEFWGSIAGFSLIGLVLGVLFSLERFRLMDIAGVYSRWSPLTLAGFLLVSAACWVVAAWAVERTEI